MISTIDHACHSAYSDPGRHAELFTQLPTDPDALSAVSRNLIAHYRIFAAELPAVSRSDIDARWLEAIVDLDQARHGESLTEPRPLAERVQGCCRDHTLFCVGVLRSHGVPARSRVGFAGYFVDGWHHDHVIVEAWLDGRWQRFDSELEHALAAIPTPMDIDRCSIDGAGFVTAAQAWAGYRSNALDAETYGIDPAVPGFRGGRFIFDEVIHEVAHRFGDELLLWDAWGRIGEPDEPVSTSDAAWLDGVSDLLLAADRDDMVAERDLADQYRADEGLRPGAVVMQASPYGHPPIEAALDRRQGSRRTGTTT